MKPKTTLVERMARAIAGAEGAEPDAPAYPEISRMCMWETFKPAAIAALEAIRKPDNTMLKAAGKAMSPERRPTQKRISVKAKHAVRFTAMIDAAIAEASRAPGKMAAKEIDDE